jgi:hypothetical protein
MASEAHTAVPPAGAAPAKSGGAIDAHDVEDWKNRFNEVLSKPSEHINSKSPEDSREWNFGFWGCCNPIDLCKLPTCKANCAPLDNLLTP